METIIVEELSVRQRVQRIVRGIRAPKESGDHKYAMHALTRLFGPSSVSLLACFGVLMALVTLVARKEILADREIEITVVDPETVEIEELKDFLKDIELQPVEPPELTDMVTPVDLPDIAPPADAPTVGQQDMQLAQAVPVLTRSPLIMRNLYGARTTEGRRTALRAYGGSGRGEDAVLRALRWLKANQDPDGSWKRVSKVDHVAMSGLALLTFLAHGETPASEEFGATVENAIKYLIGIQRPNGSFSANAYTQGICAYAISEAYALTRIMAIMDPMERALQVIIDGQQDDGGYDYVYKKGDRFDTSVAGWQFQAMKAGVMAGSTNPRLEQAVERGIHFLKTQSYAANGSGFVYSGTPGKPSAGGGRWTMTGVGTLCLQLLGHARAPETRAGVAAMEALTCKWNKAGNNSVYGWYYVTQAKFQQGGRTWDGWNAQFAEEFIKNQETDGRWEGGDHGGCPVYTTTLVALSLQVYYRYLPTFRQVEDVAPVTATSRDDIVVDVL